MLCTYRHRATEAAGCSRHCAAGGTVVGVLSDTKLWTAKGTKTKFQASPSLEKDLASNTRANWNHLKTL